MAKFPQPSMRGLPPNNLYPPPQVPSRIAAPVLPTGSGSGAEGPGCVAWFATFLACLFLIFFLPLTIWGAFKSIAQYERAVIYRLGRLRRGGPKGPGTFFLLRCIDKHFVVDLRVNPIDIPPQEVLTKDSVTITVDAVIYYGIFDPVLCVSNVMDFNRATRLLAACALRNIIGTKELAEVLKDKSIISGNMQMLLDHATDPWGVKVERVEIKDVRLPVELQRAMALEAETAREAKAKVITAQGEVKASQALKEASDIMASSPGSLQLRYLQTMGMIGNRELVIFPLPVDVLKAWLRI